MNEHTTPLNRRNFPSGTLIRKKDFRWDVSECEPSCDHRYASIVIGVFPGSLAILGFDSKRVRIPYETLEEKYEYCAPGSREWKPFSVHMLEQDERYIRQKFPETAETADAVAVGTVVVTRNHAIVSLLVERGMWPAGARIIEYAREDDVRGKDVIGSIPLSLAALARSVTEIPITMAPDDRGKELSLEWLRQFAGDPVTYVVTRKESR